LSARHNDRVAESSGASCYEEKRGSQSHCNTS
jgi:hypothetical protein